MRELIAPAYAFAMHTWNISKVYKPAVMELMMIVVE